MKYYRVIEDENVPEDAVAVSRITYDTYIGFKTEKLQEVDLDDIISRINQFIDIMKLKRDEIVDIDSEFDRERTV